MAAVYAILAPMKITGKKYLLFDLDGTLTDPGKGITNGFINAIDYFHRPIPSYQELCKFIGPPLKESFMRFLGWSEADTLTGIKKYREYYSTTGLFENEVYAGIPQLLEKLQAAGYILYVATSKPEDFSVRITDTFDLSKYFVKVCGSAMDETRTTKTEVIAYVMECAGLTEADKPAMLMIGDRHHDIDGARNTGIDSCGILWGYGSREELETAGADWIAATVDELAGLLL